MDKITYIGRRTPKTAIKFRMPGAVHAKITNADFGEDRSRLLGWRWVDIQPFPLNCIVVIVIYRHLHYCASVCCWTWSVSNRARNAEPCTLLCQWMWWLKCNLNDGFWWCYTDSNRPKPSRDTNRTSIVGLPQVVIVLKEDGRSSMTTPHSNAI